MSWTKCSNFRVSVESYGREHLEQAIKLAAGDTSKIAYFKHEPGLMRFYWHMAQPPTEETGVMPLPYAMPLSAIIEMVWSWLTEANRGNEPDIDGSVEANGFRVENTDISGWSYELFRVHATWTIFHK